MYVFFLVKGDLFYAVLYRTYFNIKKCSTFAPCFGAKPSLMEVTLNRELGVNPGLYPQL